MSKSPEDLRRMRRIIAEDPCWSLAIVPTLSNLCLQNVIRNFEETPIFEELTSSQKDYVMERLSPSLPLRVTANLITDGVYWKRCCEQRWDICDVFHYGHSWKRMFFERHLENMIELYIPGSTDPKTVLAMVPLCKSYVKRLVISQLLPPVKEPRKEEEELDFESDGPPLDHFDFSILLDKMINLEELNVVYQVKECGMNFEWKMFEMSDRDCESLAKALQSRWTMKILKIQGSHVGDKKCRLLVQYLFDHSSLKELDFSHNQIGDRGARAIGKLLTRTKLEILNMCDNNIGDEGAEAIALSLSKNSTLQSLSLRLNNVKDEGGEAICKALLTNKALRHLHLGANKVTAATAILLSKVLVQSKTLRSLNLSCNKLGVDGGKALAEAMSQNTLVIECDIRLTEVDESSASFINEVVWTNQSLQQDKQAQETWTK